jgi:predicted glutamine amidotransferase
MCRWNAWFGQPIILDELLYQTQHGLIDQSLHARMGVETTNGDGFGIGWYATRDGQSDPGRYRSVTPAWSDLNLRDIAKHIESPLFLAHIRATTGTPVQETNCHPFRHRRWLFVHNGAINGFHLMRRDLMLAVDPAYFDDIRGSTDSETLFYLALTFGLDRDPIAAVEQAVGFVESIGLWAVRYSSEGKSRTLYASADADTLRKLHPDNPYFARFTDEDRVIVSEPLSDLPGVWVEVPESTALVVQQGKDEHQPFKPRLPVVADAG